MIKDRAHWKDLEDEFIKNTPPLPYHEALRMFESMWKEGISLGVLPPEDPLDGIEVDMEIARILNSCSKLLSQK